MPVSIDIAEEGDDFDATKLNAQFTPLQAAVNDLASEDISRGALRRDHLPTPLDDAFFTAATRGGLTALCPPDPNEELYQSGLTLSAGPPYLGTWQAFNGASPYGPVSSGNGWRIPAHGGSLTYAAERRIADTSASPGTQGWGPNNSKGVTALLLEFELNLAKSDGYTIGQTSIDPNIDAHLWVAVGYELTSGTRGIIERSIRWFPVESHARGNVGTFALLELEDIPEGQEVAAVFGAVLTQRAAGATALGTPVYIDYYHFSYEPIHGAGV